MRVLTITLVTDGSSDRALVPIIEWLLASKLDELPFSVQIAEGLPPLREGLAARIRYACAMYPCDILVIHRDAEREPIIQRIQEIHDCVAGQVGNWIPLVPVRMTEAWLLFNERAIRRAAGNINGAMALNLPRRTRWEQEPDPKDVLFTALKAASGLNGRRLKRFDVNQARTRVANLVDDFAPLRGLDSFDRFEARLDQAIGAIELP